MTAALSSRIDWMRLRRHWTDSFTSLSPTNGLYRGNPERYERACEALDPALLVMMALRYL